jgi:hypothetical protein
VVLDDLSDGSPEEWHFHALDSEYSGHHKLRDCLDHGPQDQKGHGTTRCHYRLASLVEVDDTYFGAPKSGKKGRGAAGKAKVVVAVETQHDKPGFACMQKIERLSGDEISQVLGDRLDNEVVSRSDGWRAMGC